MSCRRFAEGPADKLTASIIAAVLPIVDTKFGTISCEETVYGPESSGKIVANQSFDTFVKIPPVKKSSTDSKIR